MLDGEFGFSLDIRGLYLDMSRSKEPIGTIWKRTNAPSVISKTDQSDLVSTVGASW